MEDPTSAGDHGIARSSVTSAGSRSSGVGVSRVWCSLQRVHSRADCYLRQGARPLKGIYYNDSLYILSIFRAHMGPYGPGAGLYEGETLRRNSHFLDTFLWKVVVSHSITMFFINQSTAGHSHCTKFDQNACQVFAKIRSYGRKIKPDERFRRFEPRFGPPVQGPY